MAEMEVSPQEEMANPQGMKVFAVERPGLPEDFVSFSALCGVQSSPLVICCESAVCSGSATVVGTGGDTVLEVRVLLSSVLKLLERTLVNRAYQLTRTLPFPARAETVESTTSTVEDGSRERLWSECEPKPVSADQIHSTHGTQSPELTKLRAASYVGVRYTWPLELTRETELQWKNHLFLLKLKACAGQRITLFERLDWKTPCLMHTLANQLRLSQKNTWVFYASVDGLSLGTIKRWHI